MKCLNFRQSVELEAFNSLLIRDVTSTLLESETEWEVQLDIYMEAGLNGSPVGGTLEAMIHLDENTFIAAIRNDTFFPNVDGECDATISLTVPKVQHLELPHFVYGFHLSPMRLFYEIQQIQFAWNMCKKRTSVKLDFLFYIC